MKATYYTTTPIIIIFCLKIVFFIAIIKKINYKYKKQVLAQIAA